MIVESCRSINDVLTIISFSSDNGASVTKIHGQMVECIAECALRALYRSEERTSAEQFEGNF